jgi:hypothetical protein
MKPILFIKSAPLKWNESDHSRNEKGEFAHKPSMHVESSIGMESFEQARAWWRKNLGGKVADLTVHLSRSGDGWKKTIKIKVNSPPMKPTLLLKNQVLA